MNITPSLLLVDDERSIRSALRRELQYEGYQIFEAGNAKEALAMMSLYHIDALITDQRMPFMCGSELLEIVKKKHPRTVTMMLSGYTDFGPLVAAINNGGITAFIQKPWYSEELREIVMAAMKKAATDNHHRQ